MLVLTASYSVMVQQYHLYIKALLYAMFKGFKVVDVMHGVVACKDNDKVSGCSDGCIAGSGGYKVVVVVQVFGWFRG